MDKHTASAFTKLQKREHLLRVLRDQMGLGRITREVFRQQSAEILARFALTEDEERAYDRHCKVTDQRKRK
jgi:hypothetical protein